MLSNNLFLLFSSDVTSAYVAEITTVCNCFNSLVYSAVNMANAVLTFSAMFLACLLLVTSEAFQVNGLKNLTRKHYVVRTNFPDHQKRSVVNNKENTSSLASRINYAGKLFGLARSSANPEITSFQESKVRFYDAIM